jgi:quercetin dioxygenase-like cupin family protein
MLTKRQFEASRNTQQSIESHCGTHEEDRMNTLLRTILGASMALAISAPASAGDVFVVQNTEGKKPIVLKNDSFAMAPVAEINKKPNTGFSYTQASELPGTGIKFMRGHLDAKGTIAVHEGPSRYILYVISGSGKLTLNDKQGEKISELTYKPDDVIIFEPNTSHGWINGDAPFEFVGVDYQISRP